MSIIIYTCTLHYFKEVEHNFYFNVNFLLEAVAIRNLKASLLKLRQNQDADKFFLAQKKKKKQGSVISTPSFLNTFDKQFSSYTIL